MWTGAVAGADYVLHVASPVPTVDPRSDEELVRPARDGTLRVIRAARDAGVKRVVMTSSISAIIYGRGVREKPFTEEDWTDGTNRDDSSPYDRKSPTWRHGRGLRPKTGSSSSSRSTPVWFSAPFSDQTFLLRLIRTRLRGRGCTNCANADKSRRKSATTVRLDDAAGR